jgi:hypothetical protein
LGRKVDTDQALVEADPLVQSRVRSAESNAGATTSSSSHRTILGKKSSARTIVKPPPHTTRPGIDGTSIRLAAMETRHTSQVALATRNSAATPVFGVGF